ncbi:MAG TPA: DUF1592 domain-containing protein [Tepidisphaeraceae bacterium]|nr:DUF1592 domain-containing protein [Tepidisphaeraceae bacterium]
MGVLRTRRFGIVSLLLGLCAGGVVAAPPAELKPFVQKYCAECHDDSVQKGDLDLTGLTYDLADPKTFAKWVTVHDRVAGGEMPPKGKDRPGAAELKAFTRAMAGPLAQADRARAEAQGRATQRRLNRYEYENVVRELLGAPWLQIRDGLPEDGEAHRFNKVGDAMDVSHVQVARYMGVADAALRQVMASQVAPPASKTARYYARDNGSFARKMKFSVFNTRPERATFPVLASPDGQPFKPSPQADVRAHKAPLTSPETREREAMGVVASSYEPLEIKFNEFTAPAAGRYKLRIKAFSVWAGEGKDPKKWFIPDLDEVERGRRSEPVVVYAEIPPRLLRRIGAFDAHPEPGVAEMDVYLLAGETIRPDAARLFRSRPPAWHNPLAEKDGCPGVAFQWLEVEGPINDQWPPAGHKVMFGDLPIKANSAGGVDVVPANPRADAEKLLARFMEKAYRRPVGAADVTRFMAVVDAGMKSESSFADAMIAGYTAVLCSPGFVCVEERVGPLDDYAVASRLSFFLSNAAPDDTLRKLAAAGELKKPEVLRAQVDRLLGDPKSRQFVDAFLDYWLDLRKINNTSPDGTLYPDYYLDDLLTESALEETQLFFAELIKGDLPAKNVVASDFAMLNERLATHYGIKGVEGVGLRKVPLPAGHVRGGLLTQASVLKVTANGTTTSPVMRGVWVTERILGMEVPPPPPSVPAVEPDTRGATTIREQLDKHRSLASCNGCHVKIDPAGFALENFDVMGGWQDRYRALGDGKNATPGIGKNGQKFTFHAGPKVDATGDLPDGRKFADVQGLKKLLVDDERQVARNLVRQLVVYATGAPVRFGDRDRVEAILDRAANGGYGVKSLIREIVLSELFLKK